MRFSKMVRFPLVDCFSRILFGGRDADRIVAVIEKHTIVGYPCAHIFHLSCLLRYTTKNNDRLEEEEQETPSSRDGSIGPKIKHASRLKGKIGGCPVNVHKEDTV